MIGDLIGFLHDKLMALLGLASVLTGDRIDAEVINGDAALVRPANDAEAQVEMAA